MKIFVIVIIFLAGIELSPAGIPYPPDEIWSGAASVPTVARPDYLSTIIDPTFSTEVTRITSLEGWRNHYPKDQAWNCDATMRYLRSNSMEAGRLSILFMITTNMFSGGTSDCDGDGASDYHEYISDTIPTSNLSFFQINTLQHTNYHSVTFACSTSRVYSLQYATNPVLNSWSTVDTETNITGETDGTLSLDDTNTYPFNCYRVRVALP